MSAGAELIELQHDHECVMAAVKSRDRERIAAECKAFWTSYNSLELDSGVMWIAQTVAGYAEDVRTIEAEYQLNTSAPQQRDKVSWWKRWRKQRADGPSEEKRR